MFHISVNGRKSRKMDPEKRDERIGVWVLCCIYSVIAGFTTLGMSVALSQDISDDYGTNHVVDKEPSYDEAATLAGYFDSDGVYQGGKPKWADWSEDSFLCNQVSESEKYCQAWSTERFYSDPEQEFLKGNCTCIRPLADTVSSTFDVWSEANDDSQATSSSQAALEEAEFCSAWNCQETRFTEKCTCVEYETRTTCTRRQLKSRSGGSTGKSCSTYEVCVAYSCEYVESNFYTACDCDSAGLRRSEGGADWWRDFTHCEDFKCHHANSLVRISEDVALASSATDSASLAPGNASFVPTNATVSTTIGQLEDFWTMDYACTQTNETGSSLWCDEWRGITGEENADVVEQLCECTDEATGDGGTFCASWSCTTYFMDECQICSLAGVGMFLGGLIVVCLAPLYSCAGKGYLAQPVAATPFGISSSSLVAAIFGGWTAIWGGVIPGFLLALFLGWLIARRRPKRIEPGEASEAKPQPPPTPMLTPMAHAQAVQMYQQAAATGATQQSVIPYGAAPGGYTYNPPGGQQQPMQYSTPTAASGYGYTPTAPGGYSPTPTAPGGYAPPEYGGGGVQGAYGGGFQAGGYAGTPPPGAYQNPPQFKTGVDGGPGGY